MSETLRISSENLKDWLEKETGPILIPVHEKAQKLLNEMKKTLENVTEISEMLLDNSVKEIEKRNMKTYRRARALNKLARLFLERMRQVEAPDRVSYGSFHDFVQETQKAFVVTEVDIRNWFPRISPFFIMDRRKFLGVFEKSKKSLKELQNFLSKEYVKTKTLEETFQLIDNLQTSGRQLTDLEIQKEKNKTEKASIEKEIVRTQQEIADLRNRDSLTRLNQVDVETDKLRNEVKYNMRHLRKPFMKFQSEVYRKGGLTPEELEKLNQYVESPFDAFAGEEMGYPILKQILTKLSGSMSEGKLKLKPDRKRKAEQATDRILRENALDTLHRKCREAITLKKKLSTSAETVETEKNILKLQEELTKLEREKGLVESEARAREKSLTKTLEMIRNQKKQIERNIFGFMDKRVLVEFKVE